MYNQALKKLYSLNQYGSHKLGLQNPLVLAQLSANPEKTFPTVHVAGSNGKGSVATKIAKGFELSGKKVGLYTSPHLVNFRERIQINGVCITEEEVLCGLNRLFSLMDTHHIPATYFEVVTMLAFFHFSANHVDIAIIEAGLGGRLDATNIITPILSVITSISLEHTETLGDTLELIAEEKAGIIKPGVPVVIGPTVPIEPISKKASETKSDIHQVQGSFQSYHEENNAVAGKAMAILGLNEKVIHAAFKAVPPCRMEIVSCEPLTYLDVAHNPSALEMLFKTIRRTHPTEPIRVVCGLSANKDLAGCAAVLRAHAAHLHWVQAPNPRGAPVDLLSPLIPGGATETTVREGVLKATEAAKKRGEILVICGTFFMMEEVKLALQSPRVRPS